MKHGDFSIGLEFVASAGFIWRCTDVGTRTITAIHIEDGRDANWYNGPPYPVAEVVFDEYDLPGCHCSEEEAIEDAIHEADTSGHPGYPNEDVIRMNKEKRACELEAKYPNKRLLRFDRIREEDELLHPYAARKFGDGWIILLYLPFLHEYAEMPEMDVLRLSIATKADVKRRAKANPS